MNSKMKSKMDEKWMKKANCEQPYCCNSQILFSMICFLLSEVQIINTKTSLKYMNMQKNLSKPQESKPHSFIITVITHYSNIIVNPLLLFNRLFRKAEIEKKNGGWSPKTSKTRWRRKSWSRRGLLIPIVDRLQLGLTVIRSIIQFKQVPQDTSDVLRMRL